VTFTLLGRVYTLTLLANFLLLKHLGSNKTIIDTVGPTFRRNTTTVNGATVTGPAVFNTRMSQDASGTCRSPLFVLVYSTRISTIQAIEASRYPLTYQRNTLQQRGITRHKALIRLTLII